MFEDGLYSLLTQPPADSDPRFAAVRALVALQGTKVFPVLLPEGTALPASKYQTVGGSSKPGFTTSGPQKRRLQIDHIALDARAAWQLRDATRAVLDGFHGVCPNGFFLTSVLFLQPIDHFDNDARQFRCAAEYYFTFNLP